MRRWCWSKESGTDSRLTEIQADCVRVKPCITPRRVPSCIATRLANFDVVERNSIGHRVDPEPDLHLRSDAPTTREHPVSSLHGLRLFYQLYELNHAALPPWRRLCRRGHASPFRTRSIRSRRRLRPLRRRGGRALRAHHAPLRQAGIRPHQDHGRLADGAGERKVVWRSRSARSSISSVTCRPSAGPIRRC